ncbi:MAG: hypothetical protein ACKVOE_02675 [Rickettsiales bacterium]
MLKRKTLLSLLLASSLTLTACGDTRFERAGSGAIIGGAAGGASGVICCGNPLDSGAAGLIIGAAVGALIGFIINHPLIFDDGYRE